MRRTVCERREAVSQPQLSGSCGVSPQKGSAETRGSAAGEGFPQTAI
jgi:hypothetical protein